MPRRLLTTLGTAEYQPARWYLQGHDRTHETCYAPVATVPLVPGIHDAVMLLTKEAEDNHWDRCRQQLEDLGVSARRVRVPAARTEQDIWAIFSTAVSAAEGAEGVVLDITHAFRHLPFVLSASLAYVTALRALPVGGIYYGAYEAREGDRAPLLDLGPLLALGEWAYAARSFRETGNPRWLARAVEGAARRLALGGEPLPALAGLKGALQDLQWALPTGLLLEAGFGARRALAALERLQAQVRIPAPLSVLLERLRETFEPIAIEESLPTKASVRLEGRELARQLRLARLYHEWGQDDRALLVLREWVISRCLLAERGSSAAWLDYEQARLATERAINGLAARQRLGMEPERALGSLWQRISRRRNSVAHAGLQPDPVRPDQEDVRRILEQCENHSASDEAWRAAPPGPHGRVLVTPLGKSPGVIYTALVGLKSDRVLVITSAEAEPLLVEARDRAGWALDAVTVFRVQDPHACFGEVSAVLEWARPVVLGAREVLVNITGGTTAMQYLAERVAADAARLGIPTRRYALVDRRSREDQEREPYVTGECVALAGDAPPDGPA
jgi:CRISPR-associated DxTHG motif protein